MQQAKGAATTSPLEMKVLVTMRLLPGGLGLDLPGTAEVEFMFIWRTQGKGGLNTGVRVEFMFLWQTQGKGRLNNGVRVEFMFLWHTQGKGGLNTGVRVEFMFLWQTQGKGGLNTGVRVEFMFFFNNLLFLNLFLCIHAF